MKCLICGKRIWFWQKKHFSIKDAGEIHLKCQTEKDFEEANKIIHDFSEEIKDNLEEENKKNETSETRSDVLEME